MDLAGLPPVVQERVVCSVAAAAMYGLPANLLLAVAEREGGRPGQWVRNRNGTFDVGAMQLNTVYLAELRRWGILPADAAQPGCYPYQLAAWRLRNHLQNDAGDVWQRAANYHSRTPFYNARYRAAIIEKATRWADWLSAHRRYSPVRPADAAPLPMTFSSQAAKGQHPPSFGVYLSQIPQAKRGRDSVSKGIQDSGQEIATTAVTCDLSLGRCW